MKATIHGQFEKDEFVGKPDNVNFSTDDYFVGVGREWIGDHLIGNPKCYLYQMAMREIVDNKNEQKGEEINAIADVMEVKGFWKLDTTLNGKIFNFSISYNIPEEILNGVTPQEWVKEYIIGNSIKYQEWMDKLCRKTPSTIPAVTKRLEEVRKDTIQKLNTFTIT